MGVNTETHNWTTCRGDVWKHPGLKERPFQTPPLKAQGSPWKRMQTNCNSQGLGWLQGNSAIQTQQDGRTYESVGTVRAHRPTQVQTRHNPSTEMLVWTQSPTPNRKTFVNNNCLVKKKYHCSPKECHLSIPTILQDRTHAQEQLANTKQTPSFKFCIFLISLS